MGIRRLRGWGPLGAATVLAVVIVLLLYLPSRFAPSHRDDLSAYGAYVLAGAGIVVSMLAWGWRKSTRRPTDAAGADYLDRVADSLAAAVEEQWKKAAEERGLAGDPIAVTWSRPSRAVSVPVDAAVRSGRFGPVPGLRPARESDLVSGRAADLHAVYGGLGSGRLIIAGPPGSGKSGTAVQLMLAALRHREQVADRDRPRVPVPVLLTARDWDPEASRPRTG